MRLPDDTRGIIAPGDMLRVVDFDRYPPGDILEGLVEWFWAVSWNVPDGQVFDQRVLAHPAGNISIGTLDGDNNTLDRAEGRVYGVQTGVDLRRLAGRGWTIAARTTVGGLGALLGYPARDLTDGRAPLEMVLPGGPDQHRLAAELVTRIDTATDNATRVDLLRTALEQTPRSRPPELIAQAREAVELARVAEQDRTMLRTDQLAAAGGMSVRTLQRLFDEHVGVSPAFVIRRWRIIEAAEAAREAHDTGAPWSGWARVAADLGYSDQAHLARDFRRHLGVSPSDYRTAVTGQ